MIVLLEKKKNCFHPYSHQCSPSPSALCSISPRGERADLHWASALHREEVQRRQGDDPLPRKDHCVTGWDTARSPGGGDHATEEETQRPGEALARWWSHTLSTGEADLCWEAENAGRKQKCSWDYLWDASPLWSLWYCIFHLLIFSRVGSLCQAPQDMKIWTMSVSPPITHLMLPREPLLHWNYK